MLRYIALALALVWLWPAGVADQPREVVVSAATSLTDVLQQIAPLFQAATGERLVLNLGASNTLARQIAAGARVDVFISADEVQMDAVAADLVAGSRVALLSNELAVAVPSDRAIRLAAAADLLAPSIRRIVIGDPSAVPAGVYARGYLQKAGVWTALQRKLVPVGSARLALAAVERGAADAAVVFRTDLATSSRARLAFVVPAADAPRIVYPAAAVRAGPNAAGARRLLTFLKTPAAAAIFRRAGFTVLV